MGLSADRKMVFVAGDAARYRVAKVAANVKIYKGALLCWTATGYLTPGAQTLGLRFAGWAQEQVDNTGGADGALTCRYLTGVAAAMKNSAGAAIAQANIGRKVWVEDDQTVRATPGAAGVLAGIAESIESDGTIMVYGAPEVDGGSFAGQDMATQSDAQTAAGAVLSYTFAIPDAADADYDRVVDEKVEVVDVIVRKSGAGAGNTVTVKNGATAISDAIAAAVDKTITRAGTLDPAQTVIAAGGTLRCSFHRAAGSGLCFVTVLCVKRA